MPWARHDSAFTRAFEDLVVHNAVVANKQAAADRYAISWRAANNACVRVAAEALGRIDLLDGLVAVAIDEVNKKGQRYLTVVCHHFSGRVVWAPRAAAATPWRSSSPPWATSGPGRCGSSAVTVPSGSSSNQSGLGPMSRLINHAES